MLWLLPSLHPLVKCSNEKKHLENWRETSGNPNYRTLPGLTGVSVFYPPVSAHIQSSSVYRDSGRHKRCSSGFGRQFPKPESRKYVLSTEVRLHHTGDFVSSDSSRREHSEIAVLISVHGICGVVSPSRGYSCRSAGVT